MTAKKESEKHGFKIALIFVLRTGNGLVISKPGHFYFESIICQKGTTNKAQIMLMFGEA